MTITDFFDDALHRRSEELGFLAERCERTGDLAAALDHYAESARLEEQHAQAIPGDLPKVRELFAVSAVALWLRAERWDEAARAGCAFLAHPEMLTPDGVRAIQKLIDRAWRTAEVEQALGVGGLFVSVEARLSGGLVRQGLAPSTVVAERRDVLAPLLFRVAEWRSQKKYRRAGSSTLARSYQILEAPAIAASYGLRLYVGATAQQMLDGVAASPKDVVEQFLGLAQAIAEGPDAFLEMVADSAYSRAFLRGFRDLAPDGVAVGHVDLGAMIRGRVDHVAALTPATRERLTIALRREDEEKPVSCDGVLKSVNLRGDEPKVALETSEGARVFRIAKGEHDDTIGPKLNRSVHVAGMLRVNEHGEAAEWADDVVLVEDGSDVRST